MQGDALQLSSEIEKKKIEVDSNFHSLAYLFTPGNLWITGKLAVSKWL
jgi:hypothetical protein